MSQDGSTGGPAHFDVIGVTSPRETSIDKVGSKAFNLMLMSEAGISVPRAFVLGTSACREFHEGGGRLAGPTIEGIERGIAEIEGSTGLRFGAGRRPLLLSVRSGAAVSMPGMLDTILNVGLSDATLPGLLRATGDPVFVWDSYRRLVQAYAEVVSGCPTAPFDAVLRRAMDANGVPTAAELDVAALKGVVREQQAVYRSLTGEPFPEDPMVQVLGAVTAVFRSWESGRAHRYRTLQGLTGLAGTAVTVQAMVFGNMGATSGSGVGFTRDPATGENRLYVDFMLDAQGEDVVAGRRAVPESEAAIAALPGLAHELQSVRRGLEAIFRDAQDFEFTVQEGKLWMLQTRTAKRTAWAALRIACDLFDEGLVDAATAAERLDPLDLDSISRVRLADEDTAQVLGQGVPASDGVASGRVAMSVGAAERISGGGDPVVLVRDEASTQDIAGLAVCRGLVTATGARTSHAAVVARQLGLACVVGCRDLTFDPDHGRFLAGHVEVEEGDWLTVDGATGRLYRGALAVCIERPSELVERVRGWRERRPG